MDYTSAGNALPKKSEYDRVCRFCARDGVREGEDNSSLPLPKSVPPVAAANVRGARVGGGGHSGASVSASPPPDVNVVTAEKAACTEN